MQQFEGQILIYDSADIARTVAALATVGIEFKRIPDMVDPVSDAAFGEVRGMTELDENALWNWLRDLIRPFGEVEELGLSEEIARRLADKSRSIESKP